MKGNASQGKTSIEKIQENLITNSSGVRMGRFSTKKKKGKKKYKDDQNGPIHPENSRLNFFIIGGSGQFFGLIVRFYFILFLWSYLLKYGRPLVENSTNFIFFIFETLP